MAAPNQMPPLPPATQARNQLFIDLYSGKIPKRVPIYVNFETASTMEYVGMDPRVDQFSVERIVEAACTLQAEYDFDMMPINSARLPQFFLPIGSKTWKQGSSGDMQRADLPSMFPEEYDEFTADPYKFIVDIALPRMYSAYDQPAAPRAMAMSKAMFTWITTMMGFGQAAAAAACKMGTSTFMFSLSAVYPAIDILADSLRSFPEVMKDIRRYPDKVEAACNALLPLSVKAGIPSMGEAVKTNRTLIPLHLATYLRPKDFERFYKPTFLKQGEELDRLGYGINYFVENDWTPYIDTLAQTPKGSLLLCEGGDPKFFKEKLGKTHILNGFFPLALLRTGTKQQCIDKAKELIDILAPGGNYAFGFDKAFCRGKDIPKENMHAVVETVKTYGVY